MPKCQWFLDCHNDSIGLVEHPTLGDVEICSRHYDWISEDLTPNPTKFVPPLAAKHGRELRAKLARLEEG